MKNIASLGIGVLVSYVTLVWAIEHLGTISSTACSAEFTLPALVCRFGGFGVTLLLIPLTGAVAFFATRWAFKKP